MRSKHLFEGADLKSGGEAYGYGVKTAVDSSNDLRLDLGWPPSHTKSKES